VYVDAMKFITPPGKLRHENAATVANLEESFETAFSQESKSHHEPAPLYKSCQWFVVPVGMVDRTCFKQLLLWKQFQDVNPPPVTFPKLPPLEDYLRFD
jgi:hypothetical protein